MLIRITTTEEAYLMRCMLLLILTLNTVLLSACDNATDRLNQPRTMIIGGVPVHEHDYKLPATSAPTAPQQSMDE